MDDLADETAAKIALSENTMWRSNPLQYLSELHGEIDENIS